MDGEEAIQPAASKKRRRNSKKPLADYFEFYFIAELKMAKCKMCSTETNPVTIKMTGGNTSSVKRHLEKIHPKEYAEIYVCVETGTEVILKNSLILI